MARTERMSAKRALSETIGSFAPSPIAEATLPTMVVGGVDGHESWMVDSSA